MDDELEAAMRMSDIAHRHAMEFYNMLVDQQPVSVEYVEELFRCAIEEYAGEGRQRPTAGYDRFSDEFPYV
jgi:hypothetical protein